MNRAFSTVARTLALSAAALCLIGAKAPAVGDVAPDFTLTLIDGSKVSRSDMRGDVVVLNFWATWCGPCKQELPLLDAYYASAKSHGLRVYAVTTEDSVPIYQLKKLFAILRITPARGIKGPYKILTGVPTNYIINRQGHVRYAKAAAFDLDALNAELVPLLNEPRPAS